jgi:ankyrin repeat protein
LDLLSNKASILFKDGINDDIHSQDNKIVIQKGDLLFKAVKNNNAHMVQLLLAAGTDVNNIQDHYGYTPLHRAVLNNHAMIARMLIDADAKINILDHSDYTPLQLATVCHNALVAPILIDAGAYLNIPYVYGESDKVRALIRQAQQSKLDAREMAVFKNQLKKDWR